jgi:DNA polymerase
MYSPPAKPTPHTLVILGEAPGADEEKAGVPFVGSSGKELTMLMESAGLDRAEWHLLNVFSQRPPNNDLTWWTANKAELKKMGQTPRGTTLNVAGKKRHVVNQYWWMIEECKKRLDELKPDLIVAVGATALWLLTEESGIGTWRGNFFQSPHGRAIATFHPAAILYQYSNRPLAWADFCKVRQHLAGTLPEPAKRRLWINPTMAEIASVYYRFKAQPSLLLGADIETCPGIAQITTFSFASTNEGICIPVWDRHGTKDGHNYWPTVEEEVQAWRWIERYAQLPNPKVLQNGLYDSQYSLDAPVQIRFRNWSEDTAIMQHSYQPELPKALGTLSSIYLNEPSWKQMRAAAKDMNKADE